MSLSPKLRNIILVYTICGFLVVVNKVFDWYYKFNDLNTFNDGSYSILGVFSSKQDYKSLNKEKKIYAFLPYWLVERKNINLNFITDLSYFGLNVNSNGNIVKDNVAYKSWRESSNLRDIIKKSQKKKIRVSLTLVCHDRQTINEILNCRNCWDNLYKDLLAELNYMAIKDVNIDFEVYDYVDNKQALKFAEFVKYINQKLDSVFGDSFLAVSAYADSASVIKKEQDLVRLTNPQALSKTADAIFIMAYDFHTLNSKYSGPVSPYAGVYKTTSLNLKKIISDYLSVVDSSRLILGLPFYGYDWLVVGEEAISQRLNGSEDLGFSRSLVYHEIIDMLVSKNINPFWHEESKSFYFNYIDTDTGSKRQIWFDGKESLKQKSKLAWDNNFLGVGVWALGFEGGYADVWESIMPN